MIAFVLLAMVTVIVGILGIAAVAALVCIAFFVVALVLGAPLPNKSGT